MSPHCFQNTGWLPHLASLSLLLKRRLFLGELCPAPWSALTRHSQLKGVFELAFSPRREHCPSRAWFIISQFLKDQWEVGAQEGDRRRWPEEMEGGGRPAHSCPGFPCRPPPPVHPGPPPAPAPPQFGQEPPPDHSRPRKELPQLLPKPAEGRQRHAAEGELFLVLVPTLFPLQSLVKGQLRTPGHLKELQGNCGS